MSFQSQLIERIILPAGDLVLGRRYVRHLNNLRKMSRLNADEMGVAQNKNLARLLHFTLNKSEYYRSLSSVAYSDDPIAFLKSFPILTKGAIRANTNGMLTQNQEKLIAQKSSGSTGFQTTVYWSKDEQDIHRATQTLWWTWAGYNFGMPVLQTGITPKRGFVKHIKDLILRTYYLQAFTHSRQEINSALEWMESKNQVFLAGYASSLYALSSFAQKPITRVSAAISWGDKLFPHYRRSIEDKFACSVFETYASAEGLMMAAQKDLPYMYIMTPNVYIEIVDDEGNEVPDGQMGHVVVTNLNGYAMPLIRYKIGDLAIKLPRERYPERRDLELPLLQQVIGRDTDLVKTPGGKLLIVHSFTGVFEHIPEIRQFRVIQRNLRGIEIEYIKGDGFTNDLILQIDKRLKDLIGEPFELNFHEVQFIPPTPSGKPQIVQSFL